MENKSTKDLLNEELLRQQLELLAERSKNAMNEELPNLTNAMVGVFKILPVNNVASGITNVSVNIPENSKPSDVIAEVKRQLGKYVKNLPLEF